MRILFYILLAIVAFLLCGCQDETKFQELSGVYNNSFNKHDISFGRVYIDYLGNNQLDFHIETAHVSGCNGLLSGVAKIKANGIAEFSDFDCGSLIFRFSHRKVEVDERDCDHHGMRCYFPGVYEK